jgi:hypothetical protein
MSRAIACALISVLSLSSCSRLTPIEPTGSGKPISPVLGRPTCAPVQFEVHCTVRWWDGMGSPDVTALANWSVSERPLEQVDSDVATVVRPGVIAPLKRGVIDIRVAYNGQSSSASHSYSVDPQTAPVRLAQYLTGSVAEAGGNFSTSLENVLIEVLAPADEVGKTYLTRFGHYYLYHLPMNAPITIRASKSGYITLTKTHPGVTDDARVDAPLNAVLHFELAKAP